MTPAEINSALARALHYHYCKHANIYNSDRDIETSWVANASDRALWVSRATEFKRLLSVIGWYPLNPRELNAEQLTQALTIGEIK